MNRRNFIERLTAVAIPAAAVGLARPAAQAGTVKAVANGRRNIPNIAVTSQEGKSFRFYDDLVKDKLVLINFFYAECTGICPRMTSNLIKIQAALGKRVGRDTFIYSVSLKPEEDTVPKLAHYASMHGVKPNSGWLLLNAKRGDMELLRERLGFKDSDPKLDANINEHTGMLRFGHDRYDKWGACPLLGRLETTIEAILWTDLSLPRRGPVD